MHQPRFTAIHDNNLCCTIRVPYCTNEVPYCTIRVPYCTNQVPYCTIRVLYCTNQVPYCTIRVPYDSVTLPILPRWSRVQSCDLWQIRLKCATFEICILVSFLFKLAIEEWCCLNVSHAAEDHGHMISHIPAKHKNSVWDTHMESVSWAACVVPVAAICLLHTGFQVYVCTFFCPLSLSPIQPSYYLVL